MRSRSSTSTTTGPGVALSLILPEQLQPVEQPRHADGNAGGRHLLAGEALDEPVIATAADHGAEANGLAAIVFDGGLQLRLEDGAGVIFEPAHNRRIDHYCGLGVAGRSRQVGDAFELVDSRRCGWNASESLRDFESSHRCSVGRPRRLPRGLELLGTPRSSGALLESEPTHSNGVNCWPGCSR